MRPLLPLLLALSAWAGTAAAQSSLLDVGREVLRQQAEQRLPGAAQSVGGQSAAPTTPGALGSGLGTAEIGKGLKETLGVAIGRAADRLGRPDGFNANPALHIPLPGKLEALRSGLALAGRSELLDDLETRMNRAAEAATPEAKKIFVKAVESMSLDDARAILTGPQDSATQYFKRTMTPDLKTAIRPVVEKTLAQSGAVKSYQDLTGAAGALPLVGQTLAAGPALLGDHVVERALGGLFVALGEEEAAIRQNPAKRTTDLLKKLYSGS